MKEKITATCTWGEGPDVLLEFKNYIFILHENPNKKGWAHGFVKNGSTDLTSKQALELAQELINAANNAIELDKSIEEYFKELK